MVIEREVSLQRSLVEGTNGSKNGEDEELADDDAAVRSMRTVVLDELEPVEEEDKEHFHEKDKEHVHEKDKERAAQQVPDEGHK